MKKESSSLKLQKELFAIGLAARRDVEGYDDGISWEHLNKGQRAAWKSMAAYISKHFTRKGKV